jgi:MFS family permease
MAALLVVKAGRVLRLGRSDAHTLAATAAGSVITLVAFEPKFLWETFNGDGAHAYESARLLLHQALPFWSPAAGGMSNYPGVTSFLASYPTAWFVRLFGEIEASARIPYLLFVSAGLFPGLLALIEAGRSDDARDTWTPWLLWPGLMVFAAVMGFSATYNPYHADLALPATQDALVIAWFLGFAWAFASERWGWMCVFAGLTFATSPAGQVLLGLWLVAAALFQRPLPVRTLAVAAAAILAWFVLAKLSPGVLAALGQNAPGSEHSTGSLAKRLLKLQWRHWHRIVYFVVPGGILPALTVPLLWRQDRMTRTIAGVAMAQFAFFYFQSRVSLHYFAPAMVLPLAIFWRMAPSLWPGRSRAVAIAAVAAALLALVASLPRHPGPQLAARPVGGNIEDRLGGYDQSASASFRRSELLSDLLPRDAHSSVPDSSYGGSPLSWFYYAHRVPPSRPAAYVFDSVTAPAPAGARLVNRLDGVALYVTDEATFERDRAQRPPVSIARIYVIDKQTLFRGN